MNASRRIMVVAKKNDAIATQTEKWYGVKYQVQPINPSLINKWKEACTDSSKYAKQMTHPPKNLFIPTKFDLKYIPQPEMVYYAIKIMYVLTIICNLC